MNKKFYPICALFLCILFAGCGDDEEEDYSIGEITITGIPSQIPVYKNDVVKNNTFKVYLYASNSQSENDTPVAKGVAKFSGGSVTIQLQYPSSDKDKPTANTDPWSGTANYFSVVISPEYVSTDKENAIWAKAGLTLNKDKRICDWNSLMDFRMLMESPLDSDSFYTNKNKALFTDIVCKDTEIK